MPIFYVIKQLSIKMHSKLIPNIALLKDIRILVYKNYCFVTILRFLNSKCILKQFSNENF